VSRGRRTVLHHIMTCVAGDRENAAGLHGFHFRAVRTQAFSAAPFSAPLARTPLRGLGTRMASLDRVM
jgi:hypothetical protein